MSKKADQRMRRKQLCLQPEDLGLTSTFYASATHFGQRIGDFIRSAGDGDDELIAYAKCARVGGVL